MYLHLGQDVVVPDSEIIGIFDIDNTTQSHITRSFLNTAEKKRQVVNISDDIPKSFVVCVSGDGSKVYLSQLSSATLLKRSDSGFFE